MQSTVTDEIAAMAVPVETTTMSAKAATAAAGLDYNEGD